MRLPCSRQLYDDMAAAGAAPSEGYMGRTGVHVVDGNGKGVVSAALIWVAVLCLPVALACANMKP